MRRIRFRLFRDDLAEMAVPVALILGVAIAFLVTGCSFSPSADVIKALAGDPNAICLGGSGWGANFSFDRNHGCPSNPGPAPAAAVVVVTPGNLVPSHVEVVRP